MALRRFFYQPYRPARHGRAPSAPRPTPGPDRRPAAAVDNQTAQAQFGGHRGQARDRRDPGLEREADALAERARGGGRSRPASRQARAPTLAPPDAGRPLGPEGRDLAGRGLGLDPDAVRLHDSPTAQATAARLGARAFADGAHIWLGPGEGGQDRELLTHELAHVAQGVPGLHLRSATWLERRAWLSFFDHYLPRRFLDNYMDDTGTDLTLDVWDMIACNAIVNVRRSPGFAKELAALQGQVKAAGAAAAPAVKYIEVSGPGQAMTNGTLGNFTIHYKGVLTVKPDGTWFFSGVLDFYDIWDFDPKPFGTSGRSTAGEIKTRVAAEFLPGSPFKIYSQAAPFLQTSADQRALWAGGTPGHAGDQAGRSGADVDVGAGTGDVAAGPVGDVAGGEVGAQSGEDLNP